MIYLPKDKEEAKKDKEAYKKEKEAEVTEGEIPVAITEQEKENKMLIRRATLNLRRKYGRTKQLNILERDAFIPPNVEKEIKESLPKRKVITATELAVKYEIRVSAAKLLLKQYEQEGILKQLDPSLKTKLYIPVST